MRQLLLIGYLFVFISHLTILAAKIKSLLLCNGVIRFVYKL